MNLLEVKNICKTYGSGETTVKALKDVSFSVPKGEYVAIVGESGSGKSTLSAVLTGNPAYEVTKGSVTFYGKDLLELSPEDRAHEGIFLSFLFLQQIFCE